MDRRARGIDEIIEQAMREGAFDNLAGKGLPLTLDENPYLDEEWQLAYHLLKENGFAPDFIERRQAIEQELTSAREALARSWAWRQRALAAGEDAAFVEEAWGTAKEKLGERVKKLNAQIKTYNLQIPTSKLHRLLISIADEISNITKIPAPDSTSEMPS